MTNEDRDFVDRLEQAIDDRDPATMRQLIAEWDGKPTMSARQFRDAFPSAQKREWIDYLAEECEDLIRAIKAIDADEYWAIRGKA